MSLRRDTASVAHEGRVSRRKAAASLPGSTNGASAPPSTATPSVGPTALVNTTSFPHSNSSSSSSSPSSSSFSSSLPPLVSASLPHAANRVTIAVRCRGISPRLGQERVSPIILFNGERRVDVVETCSSQAINTYGVSIGPKILKAYEFDHVLGPQVEQLDVFSRVAEPKLEEVIQGRNCTILAYGQTGTGKTFTTHGELKLTSDDRLDEQARLIPRSLFRLSELLTLKEEGYSVTVSYLELYNEKMEDLLAPSPFQLKVYERGPGVFYVKDQIEPAVHDAREAIEWLLKGSKRRRTAATNSNAHSSRSHSIFTITVTITQPERDRVRVAKLNVVDLAGSEDVGLSGAKGESVVEAGNINKSLLALG